MKDFWTFDKEKVMNCRIEEENTKYDLVTLFQVAVPNLDDYTCTLFKVFSKADQNYPVCIISKEVCNQEFWIDEMSWQINNGASVHNEHEFEDVLKELLSSKTINETIAVLCAKASV